MNGSQPTPATLSLDVATTERLLPRRCLFHGANLTRKLYRSSGMIHLVALTPPARGKLAESAGLRLRAPLGSRDIARQVAG
jgi:hypothetical protein